MKTLTIDGDTYLVNDSVADLIIMISKERDSLIKNNLTEVVIPKGFMNVGITQDNYLVADTNDSNNWDKISFPLPDKKWVIYSITGNIVLLREDDQ